MATVATLRDPYLFKPQSSDCIIAKYINDTTEIITTTSFIEQYHIPRGIVQIIVSFAAVDEIGTFGHKKQLCLQELLCTEYKYNQILRHYKTHYIDALKSNRKILSKQQYEIICPQIWDSLLTLSTLFYNQLYDRLLAYNHEQTSIGDVFDRTVLTHAAMYQVYAVHYITNRVNENVGGSNSSVSTKWKKFNEYDERQCQVQEVHYMAQTCLVCPMSRIARYRLLLDAAYKYTADYHPDKELLLFSMERLKKIANQINRNVQELETDDGLKNAIQHQSISKFLR